MNLILEPTGAPDEFGRQLSVMAARHDVAGIMVLACDANGFDPADVDPYLTTCSVPVFGGVFPEILCEGVRHTTGTILVGLSEKPTVVTVTDLSASDVDYEAAIDAQLDHIPLAKTMFVWVDGLSANIHAIIEALFHIFGLDVNYIGGGAGSLSFVQRPCLFTNAGLIGDAAVLAMIDVASSVGVHHGWESVSGPYRVTEAKRNVIQSLNWMPAFDVYQSVIAEKAGVQITAANFFDIAKAYPFGIHRLGAEKIVRDPIQLGANGELICVGDVPVGSYVDILSGTTTSLVNAAAKALIDARTGFLSVPYQKQTVLVIDCISRTLFLQDDFGQELAAMNQGDVPMVGALTLGEIANSGRDFLEFYNKTAVVGILAE